jgi:antitoxin (DNA-binding transcriptional repressor) of toxin-antitoxin stability system
MVIQSCITMSATTSIRDLRNHFPKVRKLVESQGEVLLTEKGKPRYRLTLYTPSVPPTPPKVKDYLERLKRYQPEAMSETESQALHEDNRGER